MRPPFFIPPRVRAELASTAPPGTRHAQMVRLAMPLLGQGLSPEAVFVELRGKYAPDVIDGEIWGVIRWAERQNPQPCQPRNRLAGIRFTPAPAPAKPPTPEEAKSNAETWLKGFRCDDADLWEASPWRPPDDWRQDAIALIAALYDANDKIAITANLCGGPDKILTRNEWFAALCQDGPPQSDAGAFIRMNPVSGATGVNGTITDVDVSAYRFVLLESDLLPLNIQCSLLTRLPLPIATIVTSGGRSLHALVKVDCAGAAIYRETAGKILRALARFGFDQANKNPGRASRLPGVLRAHWPKDKPKPPDRDPRQRLFYLNPDPTFKPIFP